MSLINLASRKQRAFQPAINDKPKSLKPLLSLAVSGVVYLLLLTTTFGQTASYTDNTKDQALRGSGRINPSTLAMEFNLPLGSYPGRGINVPISLSYSSKLWELAYGGTTPNVQGSSQPCFTTIIPVYAEKSASGWTSSMTVPYIEYTGAGYKYDQFGQVFNSDTGIACDPSGSGTTAPSRYVGRITLHLPSGETHELRATDTFVNSSGGTAPTTMWEGIFYAVDGSNIKYIQNSETGTFKALMPDGSFYEFNARSSFSVGEPNRYANKFTDRNGNYTTYHAPTTQHPNGYWTDTMGKDIPVPLGLQAPELPTTAQNPQTYSMPGMTGTYKFQWKYLKGDSATESGLTDFTNDLRYKSNAEQTSGFNWNIRSGNTFLFASKPRTDLVTGYSAIFNPIVLTEIELPTGGKYKFTYNVWGEIESIVYPTGGKETFGYEIVGSVSPMPEPYDQANRGVTNRKVYETTTSSTPYEWSYGTPGYIHTINPDGTVTKRHLHAVDVNSNYGFDSVLAGMPYMELTYSSANKLLAAKLTSWTESDNGKRHPRVSSEENILFNENGDGVSTTTKYEYEDEANLSLEKPLLLKKTTQHAFRTAMDTYSTAWLNQPCQPEDDWCQPPAPTPTPASAPPLVPVRISENKYLINDAENYPDDVIRNKYKSKNMVGLVTISTIKDGAQVTVSRAETKYDETTYPVISAGSTTNWQTPAESDYRGNATTLRVWDSTKGTATNAAAYIATHAQFDNFGNQRKAWDAKGNLTETDYTSPAGQDYKFAFPTKVTAPIPDPSPSTNPGGVAHGSQSSFETTATFDPITGLPLTAVDANGLETRIEYDPVTLRAKKVKTYYASQLVGNESETTYNDVPNNYWVKNKTEIDTSKWAESITYFDGLGRAYKSERTDAQGNVFVEKEFDADGRVKRVSNPFRAGETKFWTTNVYDEASRVKEVILQDTSTVKTAYGVSTSGVVGVTKQITDQAGKKRKGVTDALGRMVRVIEDPDGENLNTDYVFDALGNLRKTAQGDQNRYFTYDSLGRLLRAKQPEQDANPSFSGASYADAITTNNQWSVKYEYDDNGNISKTTDARGVYVEGTYDKFNRLVFRNYSDTTPDVNFYYDGTGLGSAVPAYSKGKTTKVTSSVSETRYTVFDNLGRLKESEQRTPFSAAETISTATPRVSKYKYNRAGMLTEETYPSGRVVTNNFDQDGELTSVTGQKLGQSSSKIYLDNITYSAAGAVKKMKLGNQKWETTVYNSRLQVEQIGLGNSDSDQNLLKIEYGYGTNLENNGSLREQKINYTGLANQITQTYTYDDLNRLKSASETVTGGSSPTWKQTFDYDRYGNRTFKAAETNTLGSTAGKIVNPKINTTDNRLTKDQDNDTFTDYDYDAAGNLTLDAENKRFVYDAENRQKQFFKGSNQTQTPDATYEYDGEGKRVRKKSGQIETVFVYNASGQLIAEYSNQLATTARLSYLTSDHLGSPRIITDDAGNVVARHDYTAFGADVAETLGGIGGRTAAQGYTTPDDVRQQYTGYERDDESGLEYAQARYYNASHGRFTSVDPLTASASIKDPQTFNRYSYVLNSPYKFTDPLGLLPLTSAGACGQWCQNSGGYVDGSAFRGRDASFEWMREYFGEVSGYGLNQPDGSVVINGAVILPSLPGNSQQRNETAGKMNVILGIAESGAGDHNVGSNLYRAAHTRGAELEAKGYSVTYVLLHDIQGFQVMLDMASSPMINNIGIEFFGHGSWDEVHIASGSGSNTNIDMKNVSSLKNTSKTLRYITLNACYTGSDSNGIAAKLAKQLGVEVDAYTSGTIFSSRPDKIMTRGNHPNTGLTYLINDGGKRVTFYP